MTEENSKLIRLYFRVQILIVSAALVLLGATVVDKRTTYVAQGVEVVAQADKSAYGGNVPKMDRDLWRDTKDYAGILPFPIGNVVCIVHTVHDMIYMH